MARTLRMLPVRDWFYLLAHITPEVVQPAGCFHDEIVIVGAMVPVHIVDNPIGFDPANTMFDPNPFTCNRPIERPFLVRQHPVPRFLFRLTGLDVGWLVALKTRILEQGAAWGEAIVLVLRGPFIMDLSGTGTPQSLNLFRPFVAQEDVFDGVPLFFPAIMLPLPRWVCGTLNRALRAIDDKRQGWTGG